MRLAPKVAVAALALMLAACGYGSGSGEAASAAADASAEALESETATPTPPTPPPPPQLPRGGREIFPNFRVVALYGNAETPALGVLGEQTPEEAAARAAEVAAPFATPERPVLPAFELIVSVAQAKPGDSGTYSVPTPIELIRPWHEAARANGMLLVLDLQPGQGDFLTDAQRFESLLREPDVGLAIDPEWRLTDGYAPGEIIGEVDAEEVNAVSAWLADIVAQGNLPEKIFMIHQFKASMVNNRELVVDRPGLATVFHIDGFGARGDKLATYGSLYVQPSFADGFKLFYDEDIELFTPLETIGLTPSPDFVSYQ